MFANYILLYTPVLDIGYMFFDTGINTSIQLSKSFLQSCKEFSDNSLI